jgi:hypothetical protein
LPASILDVKVDALGLKAATVTALWSQPGVPLVTVQDLVMWTRREALQWRGIGADRLYEIEVALKGLDPRLRFGLEFERVEAGDCL